MLKIVIIYCLSHPLVTIAAKHRLYQTLHQTMKQLCHKTVTQMEKKPLFTCHSLDRAIYALLTDLRLAQFERFILRKS